MEDLVETTVAATLEPGAARPAEKECRGFGAPMGPGTSKNLRIRAAPTLERCQGTRRLAPASNY